MNEEPSAGGNADVLDPQWLAYELHDGLMQWVVSARMHVESARAEAGCNSAAGSEAAWSVACQRMAQAEDSLRAALEEGRQLIGFLEAGDATRGCDLSERIHQLVSRLQGEAKATGQAFEVQGFAEAAWRQVEPRAAWNLMRIGQQALQNAVTHAGPCNVRIMGNMEAGAMVLRVQDEGRGFHDSAPQLQGHFGLSSMRHRAKLISADFLLVSEPSRGTTIEVRLRPKISD